MSSDYVLRIREAVAARMPAIQENLFMWGVIIVSGIAGLAVVVGIFAGIIWILTPEVIDNIRELPGAEAYYEQQLKDVIPHLPENLDEKGTVLIEDGRFVVWFFGEHAKLFSRTHHEGLGHAIDPRYKFEWGGARRHLNQYYDEEFYMQRAGFVGKPPWPKPNTVVLVKPVEFDARDTTFSGHSEPFTVRRFVFDVWLYDLKNTQVVQHRKFMPDPWPEKMSLGMRRKRSGATVVSGSENALGSHGEMFMWLDALRGQENGNK